MTARVTAARIALFEWSGDALIGLLPLMAHMFVHKLSKINHVFALCDQSLTNCHQTDGIFLAEVSIISVVVSGLALLSLISIGPHRRISPPTSWTYFVAILALLALICGVILYAIVTL